MLEELQKLQFDSGKDSEGKAREPYKESTKRYKRRKGQATNRVTLKDSGDSYGSIKVSADSKGVEIEVPTKQFNFMVKKYGSNTIGLTDELWKKFIEATIFKDIRKKFG